MDKIMNPRTGRMVKKTGTIGRALVVACSQGCGKKAPKETAPKKKKVKFNVKPAPAKKAPAKKIDYDKVEEALDKAFINNSYQDYIEMFLDGKGGEEKQLERASVRVGRAITKVLKRTAKERKFKTDKELIDYWIKNKKDFRSEL